MLMAITLAKLNPSLMMPNPAVKQTFFYLNFQLLQYYLNFKDESKFQFSEVERLIASHLGSLIYFQLFNRNPSPARYSNDSTLEKFFIQEISY